MKNKWLLSVIVTMAVAFGGYKAFAEQSGTASGSSPFDRTEACKSAKDQARTRCWGKVKEVSACDCSQSSSTKSWNCIVDYRCEY